ncbi:MAG: chondroitinase family protein, partial [Bacteroidales bacterium]|nr:chondroitinase family protein [Bacteroidales bacterium]
MNKFFSIVILLLGLMFSVQGYSQKALGTIHEPEGSILSFEDQKTIQSIQAFNSVFEQTDLISVLGNQSLRWDWKRGSNIEVPLFNYYSEKERMSPFDKNQCLVIWIYNEQPSSGYLNFHLLGENLDSIYGRFFLDYTGWRTAHIPLS